MMMRYMGIDYGSKRIGVAISDEDGRIAFPYGIVINRGGNSAVKDIIVIFSREHAGEIIVGLPIGLDGKDTKQTTDVRKFVDALKAKSAFPVTYENEMLTSRMAKAAGMRNEHIDASSAALILQSYLDKRNR